MKKACHSHTYVGELPLKGLLVPCILVPWTCRPSSTCKYEFLYSCISEKYSCLWQECGFCSPESPTELARHVYFHCYHTKLKQWGLHALQSQSDLTPCQLDFQSRNIIPEIQENFLCLWEYCEVRDRMGVEVFPGEASGWWGWTVQCMKLENSQIQ